MPDILENSNRTFSTTEILFLIDYLYLISNDTEKLNRFNALIFNKNLHINKLHLHFTHIKPQSTDKVLNLVNINRKAFNYLLSLCLCIYIYMIYVYL